MLYVQNKNIKQYRIACLFYHLAINLIGKFEFNHLICRSACKQVPDVFVLAMDCQIIKWTKEHLLHELTELRYS